MAIIRTSLQTKLLFGFLTTTIFALVVTSFMHFYSAREQFHAVTIDRLTAARETKKTEIEKTFLDLSNQCLTISESTMSIEAIRTLKESFYTVDVTDAEFEQYKHELTDFYEHIFLPKINETATTKKTVNDFFPQDRRTIIFQTLYIARNPNLLISKREYSGTGDGSPYDNAHSLYHGIYTKYVTRLGYSDLYFIDVDTGYVLFTIGKGIDYATNLLTGPFKDTPLAETFRECQKTSDENFVQITDFGFYDPLYGIPTSFIGTPVFSEGKKLGALIFQFPVNTINTIMTYDKRWADVGLGKTGEVYLRGSDKLMRSLSRFFIEDPTGYVNKLQDLHVSPDTIDKIKIYNTTILLQRVGEAIEKVAYGAPSGTLIGKDYLNNEALLSYAPLSVPGLQWDIVAKINSAEAFAPIHTLAMHALFWSLLVLVLVFIFCFFLVRMTTAPLTRVAKELSEYKTHPMQSVTPAFGNNVGMITEAYNATVALMRQLVNDVRAITLQAEEVITKLTTQVEMSVKTVATMRESITTLSDATRIVNESAASLSLITKQNDSSVHTITDETQALQADEEKLRGILNRIYSDAHHAMGSYAELRNSIQNREQLAVQLEHTNKENLSGVAANIMSNTNLSKEILQKLYDQLIDIDQNVTTTTQSIVFRVERHKNLLAAVSKVSMAESERTALYNGIDTALSKITMAIQSLHVQSEHGKQQLQDIQIMLQALANHDTQLRAVIDRISTT
jgi:methyl-accepting chemotaxis protein